MKAAVVRMLASGLCHTGIHVVNARSSDPVQAIQDLGGTDVILETRISPAHNEYVSRYCQRPWDLELSSSDEGA
jgi:D-arabinose 1-dehydrogenase-like Zn-dependent alcohol dehydrogenase